MDKYLNTKEVAALLRINEKRVYSLASSGNIPGTMVTGKWLFSEKIIKDHIHHLSLSNIKSSPPSIRQNDTLFLAGSDDPTLSFIKNLYHNIYDKIIYSATVGSISGINLLLDKKCDLSVSHCDLKKIPEGYIRVKLFNRMIGFITRDKNVDSFKNIINNNLTFINRQIGSGIRELTESIINREAVLTDSIKGYDKCVNTHLEIASSVVQFTADVGIGVEYAARLFNLNFTPIKTEEFYFVISKEYYFDNYIQQLINTLKLDKFREYFNNIPGYDCRDCGQVI